jgi:hypothetical protein
MSTRLPWKSHRAAVDTIRAVRSAWLALVSVRSGGRVKGPTGAISAPRARSRVRPVLAAALPSIAAITPWRAWPWAQAA